MGFHSADVMIVTGVTNEYIWADGIDNGANETESFDAAGHSIEDNLSIAVGWGAGKVWLTESAYNQATDPVTGTTTEIIMRYCRGIVSNSGWLRVVHENGRYHYYFDETSIITRFVVQVEISIDAPESAQEGDSVVINITVTNTGAITAMLGAELYEGVALIGACGGLVGVTPGGWMRQQFTRAMPNHDWNLTAKVLSEPPVDATKDFTIALASGGGTCVAGDVHTAVCEDGSEIVMERCIGGEWVPTGNHCPGSGGGSTCVSGEVLTVVCDDGSTIVTERCVDGEWIATNNHCPDAGGCTSDVTEVCSDGSIITTYRCEEGTLVDTGVRCPEKKNKGIMKIAATLIGLYLYLRG